mgnify:CR=1 FL=1
MREQDIKYVIIAVLTIFFFAAFLMVLDEVTALKIEVGRLAGEVQKIERSFEIELTKLRRELQINNAICEAVINGEW